MAKEMEITIDYIPECEPSVYNQGSQVEIVLGKVDIYLYPATAEALRDALVEELGAPEGYVRAEE